MGEELSGKSVQLSEATRPGRKTVNHGGKTQEAGMTTRPKKIVHIVCIVLTLTLFPGIAHLQEQKGIPISPQAAPQGEATAPEAAPAPVPAPAPEKPAATSPAKAVLELSTYII